jgi:uncharacterized protein YegP (UPF0339 family)
MSGKVIFYKDKAGEFRWKLTASNGEIIANSGEGYTTKQNCQKGFESVKKNSQDAEVVDQT